MSISARRTITDLRLLREVTANRAFPRLITALAVAVLLIGRRPQSFFHPQLWAEDGPVFYGPQLTVGAARVLFVPYAGYLQMVSRLASIVAAHVPAYFAPTIYALIAYAIATWACSLFVDRRFANIVKSQLLRGIVCCAFTVVSPAFELVGTITNAHWYLALATLLLLIGSPLGSRNNAVRSIVSMVAIALSGLSAPETILFVPFAFRLLFIEREWLARVVPSTFLIAIAIQVAELLVDPLHESPKAHYGLDQSVFSTIVAFIHQVVITSFAGQSTSQFMSTHQLGGLALVCGMTFAGIVAVTVKDAGAARGWLVALLAISALLVGAAVEGRGMAPLFSSLATIHYGGERYFFLPIAAFILSAAIMLESRQHLSERSRILAFCALFAGGAILNYRLPALPDLNWTSYAPVVDHWIDDIHQHRPTAPVSIPINPGWALVLPADGIGLAGTPMASASLVAAAPVPGHTYGLDGVSIDRDKEMPLRGDTITLSSGSIITVRGWAIDPRTGAGRRSVVAYVDRHLLPSICRLGFQRPDVSVALHNPLSANSGFTLTFSRSRLGRGLRHLSFALRSEQGGIIPLPTGIDLNVVKPNR